MKTQVPVGKTTLAGWGTAVVAFLIALVRGLTASAAELAGPGKWQVILSAVIGAVSVLLTNLGRHSQAVAQIKAGK